MPSEPLTKRTVAFVDGQNLYHSARESFGYTYPNYDIVVLCRTICQKMNWDLNQIRFYTGVPDRGDDPFWNHFWMAKLQVMSRQGVWIYSRPLRYRNRVIRLPDGTEHTFLAGEIRTIAGEQKRWIKVACAFPLSPTTRNRRGIEKTDWLPIERSMYDTCLDKRDYRP